jgi:hypothetical protein
VRARQQITLGQVMVDGRTHDTIRCGGGRDEHLGDQIRLADIAGLGEMHLIAHPVGVPLTTVARFEVIGVGDAYRRGRLLVSGAPAELFLPWDGTAVILLEPNPPQRLQGEEILPTEGGSRSPHPCHRPRSDGRAPRVYSYPSASALDRTGDRCACTNSGGTCWRTQAGATSLR